MAVSLTDYASQIAEAARARKMAEALQAQAAAPIESQTVNGAPVPISGYSVLAKLLAGYAGGRKERMADEQEVAAKKQAQTEAMDFMKNLQGTPEFTRMNPVTAAESNPNASAGMGNFRVSNAPLAAPTAPPEMINTAKPFVAAGTPPQKMAQALQSSMANAPQVQAPQAYGNAAPTMTPQSEVITPAHVNTDKEKMAMLMQASFSGNPLLSQMAPSMYSALQTKITSDEDLAKKVAGISSLNLPKEQQTALVSAAAIGGAKGLETATNEVIKGKLGEHFVAAKPEDLAGYPEGTTGQISTTTGKLTNVYNPSSDKNAAAQLKISGGNLVVAQAGLGVRKKELKLSQDRFELDKGNKENAILDPATINFMAQQAAAGDKSVFSNLGRGQSGAVNATALRKALYTFGTPEAIAAANSQFGAIGRRAGATTFALSEVAPLADLSMQAYTQLPRDQFKPFNKLRSAVESGTNSPQQAAALTADTGMIAAYARALNPNGIARKSDIDKGEHLLNGAQSQEAHNAVVAQMLKEVSAVKQGANVAQGLKPTPAASAAPAVGGGWGPARVKGH